MHLLNNTLSIICLSLFTFYIAIFLAKKAIKSSIEKKYRDLEAKIDAEIEQERKDMLEEQDRIRRQARYKEMLAEEKLHSKDKEISDKPVSFVKNPNSVVFGASPIVVREKVEPLKGVSEDYIQALENVGARKDLIDNLKKQNKK